MSLCPDALLSAASQAGPLYVGSSWVWEVGAVLTAGIAWALGPSLWGGMRRGRRVPGPQTTEPRLTLVPGGAAGAGAGRSGTYPSERTVDFNRAARRLRDTNGRQAHTGPAVTPGEYGSPSTR